MFDLDSEFEAMKEQLKTGVRVVTAPQLFETPNDLAARMVGLADIRLGHRVLEPSAGTGRIIGAMGGRMFGHNPERGDVVAVEINAELANDLRRNFPLTRVTTGDFLECDFETFGKYDRILMNPPFKDGVDIKHILHARSMLADGGILVAICAGGPRQAKSLEPIASYWEPLPAGTFKNAGTNVNTVLLTIEK